eukprot:TRINITY_DN1604_c0_g4_i2.p1 TRINITY_DN1604_c0_g4~~TRINITY_DN1604_c0_g4_i2.p1  ORF type:complete len:861 (-),score=300.97 TRINITY_DN1604_c0_g4_i2:520-3102(-)
MGETIKVVTRVRPLSKKEVADSRSVIVQMDRKMAQVILTNPSEPQAPPKTFTFDAAFPQEVTQREVYQETAYPIVECVIKGYNGTILAYGQTGTGKTFTMEGIYDVLELRGLIPNSFQHVFDACVPTAEKQFLVRASYLEIYNENIRDLLAENPDNKLELKEHPEYGVYVKDLKAEVVKTVNEMDLVMRKGNTNRSVAATNMNATSSRSHSIYTITIESSEIGLDGKPALRQGKLNLVDLAGSERQSKTGATGDRLLEATRINLSLTALGNVISALVDGKSKHVPYRDSKLTRLLQDSLGGNSKTVMVANMGPADWNYDETLTTLRYAARTKQIKNVARINEDPKDAMLRELSEELERLKKLLAGDGPLPEFEGKPVATMEEIAGGSGVDPALLEELKMQQEAEVKRVLESKGVIESERERIVAELAAVRERKEKEAEARMALMQKLMMVQSMMMGGGNIQSANERQEAEIRRREAELEQRAIEQRRLEREAAERESKLRETESKFQSLREEAEAKTKKMKSMIEKINQGKSEISDLQAEFTKEKEDLLNNLRELNQQLSLRTLIIDSFIPPEEVRRMENRAEWDENIEAWVIKVDPNQRPGTDQPGAASDNMRRKECNILTLELDLPERTTLDLGGAPAVSAMLRDAMAGDDDIIEVIAQPNLPSMGGSLMRSGGGSFGRASVPPTIPEPVVPSTPRDRAGNNQAQPRRRPHISETPAAFSESQEFQPRRMNRQQKGPVQLIEQTEVMPGAIGDSSPMVREQVRPGPQMNRAQIDLNRPQVDLSRPQVDRSAFGLNRAQIDPRRNNNGLMGAAGIGAPRPDVSAKPQPVASKAAPRKTGLPAEESYPTARGLVGRNPRW